MTTKTDPAPQQPDNLLGICHALGETFGFNPLFLRIALLVSVMINAEATLIAYVAAGVAVLIATLATRPTAKQRAVAVTEA